MKKIILGISLAAFIISCNSSKISNSTVTETKVSIDLNTIKDDKVQVTVIAPKFKSETVTYYIPKIIPGTYSEDDYGRFIENFTAYDAKGNKLKVAKFDENSWTIANANKLDKITYWVNDTYDSESKEEEDSKDPVFSPAGTNISANNFMLNMHGFVGYFEGYKEYPYQITIQKPEQFFGATALTDLDASNKTDLFKVNRYHEVVDHPIMYNAPDTTSFNVGNMNILLSVYSPNKVHAAQDLKPAMEKMMKAQKQFLGDFNSTEKYAILLYLSTMQNDAQGFGALEHMTSTTVVMPEIMDKEMLEEQLKDVVSHEFFHIVTPLSIHSEEIHNFDYNQPKMSQHLWMYEGVTEYFANLFQVNQGLIEEEEFYTRMDDKIRQAYQFDDTMPFTKLSKNVLQGSYKDSYINVYQKGALIAMCLDIELREASNGKTGILDLMKKLSNKYGSDKPFKDDQLFNEIVALTNPSIKTFIDNHIQGDIPIDYEKYFSKMGVGIGDKEIAGHPFISYAMQIPLIEYDQELNKFIVPKNQELSKFFTQLKLQKGDVLDKVNDEELTTENIYDLLTKAAEWKEGDDVVIDITRNKKSIKLKGKVLLTKETVKGYKVIDNTKSNLRNAWLKG